MKEETEDIQEEMNTDEVVELNENELETLDISDTTLEKTDKEKSAAAKEAKKAAKKLRTPSEVKKSRIKKVLIAGAALLITIAALLAIPRTRWPIMNFIGFRGNLQITVQQKDAPNPVQNASVKLADGQLAKTDTFGRVTFFNTKLGPQAVLVQKAGYGDVSETLTNSLGTTQKTLSMKVIGIQLNFDLKNWLSGQPVGGAKLTYQKSTAESDQTGRASLIIPPTDKAEVEVSIAAPGYLNKTVKTEIAVESREVSLVGAQKNYFISKRDGKFDIFSSNLDGTEQKKIIEATGKEDEGLLQFTINKNNKQAILVATRDGKIQNGRLIAGVYVVDLEKSTLKKVDEGSDIQLFDWSDTVIAYRKSDASLNYNDAAFSRLVSLNVANNKLTEIMQTNYFAAAMVAQNKVFYMPSDPYRTIENAALTSYDLTSGAKKTYLAGKQINYVTRATYATLELQDSTGANYELQVASGAAKSIDRRPGNSFSFALSPNSQLVAWSDRRDGQGALLTKNTKNNEEKIVAKAAGLISPVRFVSDDLMVVRVATSQETADYVVSLISGKLTKIVDVSNVGVVRQGDL